MMRIKRENNKIFYENLNYKEDKRFADVMPRYGCVSVEKD
jgi:hypothetical protein